MSTWFDEAVACPACGHEQITKLARGIHVARAPEARDQIFDRTFHRVTCACCHVRYVARRPLVYTDMDRKHWVHVALEHERPLWPELEKLASEVFERAFIGSPLTAELRDGFRLRLVFGIEELREKLVIWRAGFSDSVVESAKLQLCQQDPSLALAHRILVEQVLPDGAAELHLVDADGVPARRILIPAGLLASAHGDEDRLQRYLPELFGAPFVSTHRLLGHRYRRPDPT